MKAFRSTKQDCVCAVYPAARITAVLHAADGLVVSVRALCVRIPVPEA